MKWPTAVVFFAFDWFEYRGCIIALANRLVGILAYRTATRVMQDCEACFDMRPWLLKLRLIIQPRLKYHVS